LGKLDDAVIKYKLTEIAARPQWCCSHGHLCKVESELAAMSDADRA